MSVRDLYKRLIDMGEEIGLATVYRVLNQFDDAGIVTRHNFEGGKSVFELTQQHHHDHLILPGLRQSDRVLVMTLSKRVSVRLRQGMVFV